MGEAIIKKIREKGLLLEKEIYDLLNGFNDDTKANEFLEQIEKISGQKFITKSILTKNVEYVRGFVGKLPGEDKAVLEKVFINFGINLEVRRESEIISPTINANRKNSGYRV